MVRGKIRDLCEMGVDAFKTDFGERVPTDVIYYDGSDPKKMHNYYTYLYNKTVFDALKDLKRRDKPAFLHVRQRSAVRNSLYTGAATAFPTTTQWLKLSVADFRCVCRDSAIFPMISADLKQKALPTCTSAGLAFGLMSTHSRLHGSSSYRVPWNFDEESSRVAEFFVNLKGSLMPYLYANAVTTHKTGIPMMRAMVVDFGYDRRNTLLFDTQYMLGDSLLVAPVFSEDGECSSTCPTAAYGRIYRQARSLQGGKWYRKSTTTSVCRCTQSRFDNSLRRFQGKFRLRLHRRHEDGHIRHGGRCRDRDYGLRQEWKSCRENKSCKTGRQHSADR